MSIVSLVVSWKNDTRGNENRNLQIVYYSCPSAGAGTLNVPSGSTLRLALSSSGKLCTLTQRSKDGKHIIPFSRSYDGNPWEAVAGPYNNLNIKCNSEYCQLDTPAINSSQHFILESFERNLSLKDEAARFFEQASFGVTTTDLSQVEDEVDDKSDLLQYFTKWTYEQMYEINPTSHRGFWRRRTFPFYETGGREGRATRPCESGAFYRAFAFTDTDRKKILNVKVVGGNYALYIDGKLRTLVNKFELEDSDPISFPFSIEVCAIDSSLGGSSKFFHDGKCRELVGGNPVVSINGMQPQPVLIIGKKAQETIMNGDQIEMMTLQQSYINTQNCNVKNQPVFLQIYNGVSTQTLLYEPRFAFRENLMLNPLNDGGGGVMKQVGGESAQCSNVPRTFQNEENCRMANDEDACAPREFIEGFVKLSPFNIKRFYRNGGRFVYAVKNLRLSEDITVESPCMHGVKSRWKIDDSANGVCDENVQSETAFMFHNMLDETDDPNPHVKDLYLPQSKKCHEDDLGKIFMTIKVGGNCWTTVHPDHLNVYDFTQWSNVHPGNAANPQAIKQFARNGDHTISYPAFHGMRRWNQQEKDLPYLGRLGDEVEFRDFPDNLRYPEIGKIFGLVVPTTDSGKNGIVCGSPHEVGSGLFPTSFSMTRRPELEFLSLQQFDQQKKTVWGMVATSASDQLRQRAAW